MVKHQVYIDRSSWTGVCIPVANPAPAVAVDAKDSHDCGAGASWGKKEHDRGAWIMRYWTQDVYLWEQSQHGNATATGINKTAFRVHAAQAHDILQVSPLPEIVVFDLDYCLWPYWCEMKSARDRATLYPESRACLDALRCAAGNMSEKDSIGTSAFTVV